MGMTRLATLLLVILLAAPEARAATVSLNVTISIKAPPASADGTAIPPATALYDGRGVKWTVAQGLSYENGGANGGANITLLLYYNGLIYANTTAWGWWSYTPTTGWLSVAGDPRLQLTCAPATAAIDCSAPGGTTVAVCSVTGGNGKPVTLTASGSADFVLSQSLPPANINVAPADVGCPVASTVSTVTVTAVQ